MTVLVPRNADSPDRRTHVMDQLLQALDAYAPAVVRDEHHIGARMWVDAPDALAAAAHAVAVWNHARRRVELGGAGVFRAAGDTLALPATSDIGYQETVTRSAWPAARRLGGLVALPVELNHPSGE